MAAGPSPERSAEGIEEAAAIRANRKKAIRLCLVPGLIAGLVVGLVLVLVGLPVLIAAPVFVVVAALVLLGLWMRSPEAVIRALGAVPVGEWDHPRLQNLLDGLCATMGLPRPTLCVVASSVPNALALGRDPRTATLVVTSGLDQALTLVELEGVLAHELVHIKRHETVLAGMAVVATAPLAPVIGMDRAIERVHHLVGRGREFTADQRAASVVRYPPGIASALAVMADDVGPSLSWPPGTGRTAQLTRWLWINPSVGTTASEPEDGNLDDTRVRAAAQALR